MSEPTCERCGRPVADMAYVCGTCGAKVAESLRRSALIAGEVMTTVAKLARISAGGRRTDTEAPLPVNLSAGWEHDAAVNTLTTWARHVNEQSGRPLPTVHIRTLACQHATCRAVRLDRALGPTCARKLPAEHPMAVLVLWLAGQVDWLRHRQEGNGALDEIEDAAVVLVRIVDRQPDRVVVGQCGCGAYLYAVRGAVTVRCGAPGCGLAYDVAATREMLRSALDQSLFTAAELATLTVYLGLSVQREATRKLINQWSVRGTILAHSSLDGQPAYRFGEVVSRLMVKGR